MNDLERQLQQAATSPQLFAPSEAEPTRAGENLLAIHADLDAPRESKLARLLRRLGVPDLTVPLVTATPALRRSWFVSVAIAVFFAVTVASNNEGVGVDRIAVFLTLAPLLPLLGVALAFGRGVDPTHELVVAAPRDTFQVFLIRAVTVLTASSMVLLVSSLALPSGGAYRVAWLLPAVGITAVAMALSARYDGRRVAAIVATGWIALVLIVVGASSAAVMFGPGLQVASVVATAGAGYWLIGRRDRLESVEASS